MGKLPQLLVGGSMSTRKKPKNRHHCKRLARKKRLMKNHRS